MKLKITHAPVMYQEVNHGTTTTVAVEVGGRRLEGLAVGRTSRSGVGVDLMLIPETLTIDLGELGKSSWLGQHSPPEHRLDGILNIEPDDDNKVMFRKRMEVEGREMCVVADRWRIAAVPVEDDEIVTHRGDREDQIRGLLLGLTDLEPTVLALPLLTAITLIKPRRTLLTCKPAWGFVSDNGALFLEGGKPEEPMRYKLTEDLGLPELQVVVDVQYLRFALQGLPIDGEVTLGLQAGVDQRVPLQVRRDDELHAIMPLSGVGWADLR